MDREQRISVRIKRLLLVLSVIIGGAFTARWWLPAILNILSVNSDIIQALDAGINLVSNLIIVISALGGYLLLKDQIQGSETPDQHNGHIITEGEDMEADESIAQYLLNLEAYLNQYSVARSRFVELSAEVKVSREDQEI
jgi:hypothetical protein